MYTPLIRENTDHMLITFSQQTKIKDMRKTASIRQNHLLNNGKVHIRCWYSRLCLPRYPFQQPPRLTLWTREVGKRVRKQQQIYPSQCSYSGPTYWRQREHININTHTHTSAPIIFHSNGNALDLRVYVCVIAQASQIQSPQMMGKLCCTHTTPSNRWCVCFALYHHPCLHERALWVCALNSQNTSAWQSPCEKFYSFCSQTAIAVQTLKIVHFVERVHEKRFRFYFRSNFFSSLVSIFTNFHSPLYTTTKSKVITIVVIITVYVNVHFGFELENVKLFPLQREKLRSSQLTLAFRYT